MIDLNIVYFFRRYEIGARGNVQVFFMLLSEELKFRICPHLNQSAQKCFKNSDGA